MRMNFKKINEIHTPKTWIQDTLNAVENQIDGNALKTYQSPDKSGKHRYAGTVRAKRVSIAACVAVCCVVSLSVAAAVSDTFKDWVLTQLGMGQKISINKVDLPEKWNVEDGIWNGFMVTGKDTENEKVYCASESDIVECEKHHIHSEIEWNGKTYSFSFDYAKQGWRVYGYHYEGAVYSVYGYNNNQNQVIVGLHTGKLDQIYFLNLDTKVLTPAIDETDLNKILAKKNDKADVDGIDWIHYAVEMQVSPSGNYLLYRSNRNYYLTDWQGEYEKYNEEWYVKNLINGEETKLDGVDGSLLGNEIGFADDTHIVVNGESEEIEMEEGVKLTEHPGIYDCEKKQFIVRKDLEYPISNVSAMMYLDYIKDGIEIYDGLLDRKIVVPADASWKNYYAHWNRDIVCIFKSDTDTTCKVYLVKEDKMLDFEQQKFADVDKIVDVESLGENTYLFVGTRNGENVGYLVEISYQNFFNNVFGNKGRESVIAHTEIKTDMYGDVRIQVPEQEYVPVDIDAAEKNIGEYVMNQPIIKKINAHTLTILSAIRDENCMVMEFTLEKKGGENTLVYNEYLNMVDGVYFNEASDINFCIGTDTFYVDTKKSSNEKLYCYGYILFDKPVPGGQGVFMNIESAEGAVLDEDGKEETLEIPVTKTVPTTVYASEQGTKLKVSALGMIINMEQKLAHKGYVNGQKGIASVKIRYKNGSEYLVEDEKTYNVGTSCEYEKEYRMVFNRLVELEQIDYIVVNGLKYKKYDSISQEIDEKIINEELLFIENHPVLNKKLFCWTNWNEIEVNNNKYEEVITPEYANGFFKIRKQGWISYVLPQYSKEVEEKDISEVWILNGKLSCGLKTGMKEKQLKTIGLPLEEHKKGKESEEEQLHSERIAKYILETDYDKIYYCVADISGHNQQQGNDAVNPVSVRLCIYIKKGKVVGICEYMWS